MPIEYSAENVSYLIAALLQVVLGAYLVLAGAGRVLRNQFLLLALMTFVWIVVQLWQGEVWPDLRFAADCGLLFGWTHIVFRMLQGPYGRSMPAAVALLIRVVWVVLPLAGFAAVSLHAAGIVSANPQVFARFVVLALALLQIALTAQAVQDGPIESAMALRLIVAAATIVAGVTALTEAASLMAGQSAYWLDLARAIVVGFAALLTLAALRENPQWSLAVFVSPQSRAYLPRLAAVAGALAAVAALVLILRLLGPAAAEFWSFAMAALVGALLAVVLLSERLRGQLRVYVSKHLLPFRYDYREEWLRLIDTLAAPEQRLPLPERAIQAMAQIVGSPAGVLYTRQAGGNAYRCVAGWNTRIWPDDEVPADDPAVQFMLARQWIIDTAELARDPQMYGDLRRPGWLEAFPDALLVAPLIGNEQLVGFLVLLQSSSAFRLTFEEIDLLRTSGRQVAAHLAQFEADLELAEARQFEAFNRFTAFVMHDLKNLIAQQSLVVQNAARHKGNPAFFEDAIATIDNSVNRMSRLLRELQSGDPAGNQSTVSFFDAVRDAVERCSGREPVPELVPPGEDARVDLDRDRFVAVLSHVIRNAQEATASEGSVSVSCSCNGSTVEVSIVDDGRGMDADFIRNRLFRPFDTTKGSKGMGIGAYQARAFVASCGGSLRVVSKPGTGTTVHIELPGVADGTDSAEEEQA